MLMLSMSPCRPSAGARGRCIPVLLAALWLAGCSSPPQRAPVEDRAGPARAPAAAAQASAAGDGATRILPGAENAGKPGYHTVRVGDTIARVALEYGQNWRDIARWNGLENPNVIEVGQVLRVAPPGSDPAVATTRAVPAPGRVEPRPLELKPGAGAASATAATPSGAAASAAPGREADEEINWLWPATGAVISGFDEARNAKGLAISGKAGDPVLAAADGRVVYAGSGLRGYGNLVIVKHNNTYLTAYAHNQALLVKEDQIVRRGQKIAEMGASDAERVQLHFEIRRLGKPIDPAKLLPPR